MRIMIHEMLREALGVPSNLIPLANETYDGLMRELNSKLLKIDNLNQHFVDGRLTLTVNLKGNFNISDYELNTIKIDVEIFKSKRVDKPTITSFGYLNRSDFDKEKLKLVAYLTEGFVELVINIAVPYDLINGGDVLNMLTQDNIKIKKSLSHELKHAYDFYKKQARPSGDVGRYRAYSSTNFGIKPIDEFIHNLYYIHTIESLVRPSEVASEIENGNVDKLGFIEFLANNQTYQRLKKLRDFKLSDLKSELLNNRDEIVKVLSDSNVTLNSDILADDNKLVEYLLDLTYNNIGEMIMRNLQQVISSPMERFFGFIDDDTKVEYLKKYYSNNVKKFKNYQDYFENEEKIFNFVAEKLIKKIHKLYAMAKDDEKVANIITKINSKTTNESIIDWDLHYEQKGIEKTKFEEISNDKKREE